MDITVVQRLEEELGEHLARYQELVDFLDQEKKHLLNLDLDGLLVVSKAKERLARKIIDGTGALRESIAQTALMLGLDEEPAPTLAEIAALAPAPYGIRLGEGAGALARLKNLILRENETARHFVEESLELVTGSINILSGADGLKGNGYGSDGKKEKGVKKALPSKFSREV
ncbi:MAG: flagellar export chaperone FlgN [Deltaproteobacteria bacterium]|jgi:hypothetical protein|nr:flagellar export chaperone FlgN [Deltaproteobacteria bacterium]